MSATDQNPIVNQFYNKRDTFLENNVHPHELIDLMVSENVRTIDMLKILRCIYDVDLAQAQKILHSHNATRSAVEMSQEIVQRFLR